MKAEIKICKLTKGYYGAIHITHDLLNGKQVVFTKTNKSKGEVKRKAIQFCGDLNLEYEMLGET